jgi:MFS family permease
MRTNSKQTTLFFGILISLLYMLFYFYDYLLQTSFSVLPESLQLKYGITTETFGFLSAAFFYGYIIFQIPLGYCLDRFGLKYTAILCAGCCAIGSALYYLSPNLYVLFLARFLIGAGTACACVMSVYAVSTWLSPQFFSVGVGAVQVAGCVGSIFGQAVSSWITHTYGWHVTMQLMISFGFLLFVIYLFLPKYASHHHHSPIDRVRIKEVPRLLLNKQIIIIAMLGFIAWAPVSVLAASWMVRLMDQDLHWMARQSANWLISFWIGLAIASIVIGNLSDKMQSRRKIVIAAFFIQCVCGVLLVKINALGPMVLLLILFFLGAAASVQTLSFVLTAESVDKKVYGAAAALVNMTAASSGAVINPIFGVIVAHTNSYYTALSLFPVLSVAGILLAQFALRETYTPVIRCDDLRVASEV